MPDVSIRKILENASCHDYSPGHWLYKQGQPARHFFLLEAGLISLTELTAAGDETLIRFVFPGGPIGLIAISTIHEHVLSAQVLKASRVMTWNRDAALRLIREIPAAAANLLSIMICDVVHYYHHIRRLKTDPLERRIEWALNELSRAVGQSTSEGILIERGGYRQLAELAGTNIYSVSRELSKLERAGVVRKRRGRILLLNRKRLMQHPRTA